METPHDKRCTLLQANIISATVVTTPDPKREYVGQSQDGLHTHKQAHGSLYDNLLVALSEYPMGFTWSLAVVMTDCEIVSTKYAGASSLYQDFFRFLDGLEGMTKFRWGDHALRGMGFAYSLLPLELALNRTLTWKMSGVPYAHQNYCDCAGVGWRCKKVWGGRDWEGRAAKGGLSSVGSAARDHDPVAGALSSVGSAADLETARKVWMWKEKLREAYGEWNWAKRLYTCVRE